MEAENDFLENFMREIASELGKPYSSFEGFTTTMRENWIDSKESLMLLDDQNLAQLKFPLVLQKKISDKIARLKGNGIKNEQVIGYERSTPDIAPQNKNSSPKQERNIEKKEVEEYEPDPLLEEQMTTLLNTLFRNTLGTQQIISILQMMNTLLSNVYNNPTEKKFRTINLSKPAISSTIGSSEIAKEILRNLLFFENAEGNLELASDPIENLHEIGYAIKAIQSFGYQVGRYV